MRRIEAVLEYVFDDGVEDEKDAKLAAVKESTSSEAIDALALNLAEVAALGEEYRPLLAAVRPGVLSSAADWRSCVVANPPLKLDLPLRRSGAPRARGRPRLTRPS